jgi:hypothetical protein
MIECDGATSSRLRPARSPCGRSPSAQQSVGARYVRGLEQIKRDYDKTSRPSEAARSAYVTRLVRLRE